MTNQFSKVLAIACAIVMSASAYGQDFSRLFIFGDSLSDTGNLASGSGLFPDPFYLNSRASNGPMAVEQLAELTGLSAEASIHLVPGTGGDNYAVIGARAGGTNPIDLTVQVGAFLSSSGGIAPADALYIMFIGSNDVRDARDLKNKPARKVIDRAVKTIAKQLRVLIAAGARSIMVVNVPDVGLLPETQLLARGKKKSNLIKKARDRTKQFNNKLAKAIKGVEKTSGVAMVQFDLFQFINSISADADALGFINSRDACLNPELFEFHPDCELGANFDKFAFFDLLHPSGHTHERIGRAFYSLLPAPVMDVP